VSGLQRGCCFNWYKNEKGKKIMAARKRKETEDFRQYRENLKVEDAELKQYLKGRLIWNSGTRRKNNGWCK